MSTTYTPIRINTVKAQTNVTFNIYIHFKDHYLEYIKPNESIAPDKLKKLRKQKIAKFYILSEQEKAYQDYLEALINNTLNDKSATQEEKSDLLKGASETAIENLARDPGSESSFNMTQSSSRHLQNLLFNDPESIARLFQTEQSTRGIVQHSLNVCVLCIKFAQFKKLTPQTIDNLSTAALMHDVGHLQNKSNLELFNKEKEELSSKEKIEYFTHCKGAIEVLKDKPYINNQIVKLIELHEENLHGTGPFQKTKLELDVEILSLINFYDKKIMTEDVSPKAALNSLKIDALGLYSLELLNDFQEFLKKESIL